MRKLSFRAYLEIEDENGERVAVSTSKILQSPELQDRCVEKAALRRIINRLQKHGLGPSQLDA